MKRGDKLYCKKSVILDGSLYYQNNRFYIVKSYNGLYTQLAFGDNTITNKNNGFFFCNNKEDKKGRYIWDYFCTEQQLRELKLKEIKSVQSRR